MKLKLIFLLLFTILQSCNKNQVFNEFNSDFEDNRWTSNDVKVFEFENVASDDLHVIKLQLSHIYDFDFAEIPIEVELIAPVAIEKGLKFTVREGGRTVGAGVVTKITK